MVGETVDEYSAVGERWLAFEFAMFVGISLFELRFFWLRFD